MPIPDGLRVRTAGTDDLPRVAELRERVGWAVHEWALRAVLDPPYARCLLAVDGANHVIGVGSGISYGALGVVGNMIVDPSYRRRGVGAAILEGVVDFLDELGCTRLELSATDAGRPLYEKYGFTLAGPGVSAVVPCRARADDDGTAELTDAGPTSLAELAAYDAPRFGGDRSPLIASMLADRARPLVVARREGTVAGWAWVRPDADRVGPLVADSPDVAAALVGDALRRLRSARTVRLNFLAANRAGAARLRQLGAEIEPWSGCMARGAQVPRREDTIYGNAVGALG